MIGVVSKNKGISAGITLDFRGMGVWRGKVLLNI